MRLTRPITLLALLVATAACGSTTAPVGVAGVEARVANGALVVHNATPNPVFTNAVGREAAALVDWVPCADPDRCDPLAAGATRTTPLSQIVGGTEPELILSWWHALATPNGWRPDSIRSAIVKTR